MKKQTSQQSIYKRFKQFIILGTVAILTVCTTATATAPNFETMKQQAEQGNTTAQGDATAQFLLGFMYQFGKTITEYEIFKLSLKGQGVPKDIKGVRKNIEKSVYWYEKAAEQGNAKAQYELGRMYEQGDGVTQDYKKAVYWYTLASEQGEESASYYLGEMYEQGQGVKKDLKKAFIYYFKASEQGHQDARAELEYLKLKIK